MGRSVGTFGYRGRAHFGELRGNVDPTVFKLTNVSGGRMKRNFTLNSGSRWTVAAGKRAGIRHVSRGTVRDAARCGPAGRSRSKASRSTTQPAAPAALIRHRWAKAASA